MKQSCLPAGPHEDSESFSSACSGPAEPQLLEQIPLHVHWLDVHLPVLMWFTLSLQLLLALFVNTASHYLLMTSSCFIKRTVTSTHPGLCREQENAESSSCLCLIFSWFCSQNVTNSWSDQTWKDGAVLHQQCLMWAERHRGDHWGVDFTRQISWKAQIKILWFLFTGLTWWMVDKHLFTTSKVFFLYL